MDDRMGGVSPPTTNATMVESCSEESQGSCCGPHVFTSILLGVLACVLMTGGVFLAFHRWDPLWLIVSGIGVILVLIGSVLHCCRAKQPVPSKGCCLPDHLHNHVVLNGGSLTEQLLPLSNARSVSQLSLNMLPGYFPPVVATYGIEQHSAVVQNINRIIQQQTHNPAASGTPGKSFILLSLPGNTPQANIQNLVATVYQLDGSIVAEASTATEIAPTTAPDATTASSPTRNSIPILKNAEVQTCSVWPVTNASTSATPSISNAQTECNSCPMSTQTVEPLVNINLMDCSPDPICDISTANLSPEVNIPPTPNVLVDVFENTDPRTYSETQRTSLIDGVDSSGDNLLTITANAPNSSESPTVLIDISEASSNNSIANSSTTTSVASVGVDISSATAVNVVESPVSPVVNTVVPTTDVAVPVLITSSCAEETVPSSECTITIQTAEADLAVPSTSGTSDAGETNSQIDRSENSSLCVVDMEDTESMGRSSPPPSYEDVALQSEAPSGVFGLAYGTL